MLDNIFDWNLAIARAGGNKDLAHELTGLLAETIKELKPKITKAWDAGQFKEVGELTHKLHGGVAYTGAKHLQVAAKKFEMTTKSGSQDIKAYDDLHAAMLAFEEFVGQLDQNN